MFHVGVFFLAKQLGLLEGNLHLTHVEYFSIFFIFNHSGVSVCPDRFTRYINSRSFRKKNEYGLPTSGSAVPSVYSNTNSHCFPVNTMRPMKTFFFFLIIVMHVIAFHIYSYIPLHKAVCVVFLP